MNFIQYRDKLKMHFEEMTKDNKLVFTTNVDKQKLWELYLESFSPEDNPMFKVKREYDCNCCKNFIRDVGHLIFIKDNKIYTLWDFDATGSTFEPVNKAMSEYVKAQAIENMFLTTFKKIGTLRNRSLKEGNIEAYDHYLVEIPNHLQQRNEKDLNEKLSKYSSTRIAFIGSLEQITTQSIKDVLELIMQKSLYRGDEFLYPVKEFLKIKQEYDKIIDPTKKELFIWQTIASPNSVANILKIKNTSIGTLLLDISTGVALDTAVNKFEKVVAPTNYKRPKPIFTERMLQNAKEKIKELGLESSLERRFANIDDIKAKDVLFINRDEVKQSAAIDIFEEMKKSLPENPKKFNKVQEIKIEDFINNVLPTTNKIEVLFENKLSKNLVSLLTSKDPTAKNIFKWNNNFSWAYQGNLADSDLKQMVKSLGGNVEGPLRFSIIWNDEIEDRSDLDAHCFINNKDHIYFASKMSPATSGFLDIDIVSPTQGKPAVENIAWQDINKMPYGTYEFRVHCYSNRGNKKGFKAEVEFNGNIYKFNHPNPMKQNENVIVATVKYDGLNGFTLHPTLPLASESIDSKTIWNIETSKFVPISLITLSPNYWENAEENTKGNKHYLFMLKDCINEESPNAFFNEYLINDLIEFKHVFEALASKIDIKDTKDQLSGLGFSSTQRNELIVKVYGNIERILKIKF